ncbi:DUF4144 family protein [Zobellella maritima]|uniref:DUF4144 family protein n=1 Tax=Zobellella maritima TaxID=2059725 RepID=UPI000E30839E|nr:DUF4144 family protein [Zobellella maritima]
MVAWPAIIKYSGEDELSYIGSQSEWELDAALYALSLEEGDRLIDGQGLVYALDKNTRHKLVPRPSGESATLADIITLVRNHAAQSGACCVAKLNARTISEAITLVESLGDL